MACWVAVLGHTHRTAKGEQLLRVKAESLLSEAFSNAIMYVHWHYHKRHDEFIERAYDMAVLHSFYAVRTVIQTGRPLLRQPYCMHSMYAQHSQTAQVRPHSHHS